MYLFTHHWKSFIRNGRWRRNLVSKILLGIVILNLILTFLMLGLNIDKILVAKGENPIDIFNSFLIWYLTIDLLLRCLLQQLPTIQIIPYLSFRIRHSAIVNYLLFRSLWNLFNFIPWLIIIPFSIKLLFPYYGIGATISYLTSFFFLIILNNYLAVLIGFLVQKKIVYFLIPLSILVLLAALEKVGFSIRNSSVVFGEFLVHGNTLSPVVLLFPIIILICITRRLLLSNFYIDEISLKKELRFTSGIFGFDSLGKFGEIGRYLSLEINLLLRNKRPRQTLIMLPVMVAYFVFVTSRGTHAPSQLMLCLVVSMVTGFGVVMYGQFIFSWESIYFDGIMARKINFINYVKAKYYFMIALSLILFIPVFITFLFTGRIDVVLLFSVLLFTLGVTCFIILFFGVFNDGRLDLSRSQSFNYQGVKGHHYALSFIFTLLPIGIYLLIKYLVGDTIGKLIVAIIGIIFIISHAWWIKRIIVPRFYARKYKNLEGFRKLSL